jgi:hypothetical protein
MGEYDNLFAFRYAAMNDDVSGMRAVLARDSTFLAEENPTDLPLEFLAKLYQVQTGAREGPIEKVRRLIEEDPRLVRHPWTSQGWLPLSQAVWGDQLETVKLLLACGASGDDHIAETGGTVLHMAAELDRVEMARLMIEAGADPNAPAADGFTPLLKATSQAMRDALTGARDRYVQRRAELPRSYVDFIESRDGWEGDLGDELGYVVIWARGTIQERWDDYEMALNLSARWFPFGSDGGGEMLCFDLATKTDRVFYIPYVGMTDDEAMPRYDSFADLAAAILAREGHAK